MSPSAARRGILMNRHRDGGSSNAVILFDGRANNMTDLHSYEVSSSTPGAVAYQWADGSTHYYLVGQSWKPGYGVYTVSGGVTWGQSYWDGLNFIKNNVSLQADSRYGTIFKATAATGDSNIFQQPNFGTDRAAAQVAYRRMYVPESVDWYSGAIRVDSWQASVPQWDVLWSLGYQTSANEQCGFELRYDSSGVLSYGIESNAGYGNNATTNPVGTTNYKEQFMSVTFGRWEEFLLGVRWSTHLTGWVEIWHRTPSLSSTFTKVWSKYNIDTQMYGTTPNGTWDQNGTWSVIEKFGIYYGVEPSGTVETQYLSGIVRCPDMASAQSVLPA